MPDFAVLIPAIGMVVITAVVLLGSAVARRLHDRDRSGLWGALPLPFIAIALAIMPRVFADFSGGAPDLLLFFALFFNNLLYLGSLVLLLFLLGGKATAGDNRWTGAGAMSDGRLARGALAGQTGGDGKAEPDGKGGGKSGPAK